MKKFTIFLLTLLLFVGLINVNAQSKAVSFVNVTSEFGLYCAPQSLVTVNFQVAGGDGAANPISDPKIFMSYTTSDTTDHSPGVWTEFIPADPEFQFAPGYLSFWYLGPLDTTAWFYATAIQTPAGSSGNPLRSVVYQIIVQPRPEIEYFLPHPVCEGANVTVSATVHWDSWNTLNPLDATDTLGFTSYVWSSPLPRSINGTYFMEHGGGDTLDFKPNAPPAYLSAGNHDLIFEFIVADKYHRVSPGCHVFDTLDFEVHENPALNAEINGIKGHFEARLCAYDERDTISVYGLNGLPPYFYFWDFSKLASDTLPGAFTKIDSATYIINPSKFVTTFTTDTIYITVTDSYGCSRTEAFPITIFPLPVITLLADSMVCQGAELEITSKVTGVGPFDYIWSGYGDLLDPSDSSVFLFTTTPPVAMLSPGIYYVTLEVVDDNGCIAIDSIKVTVNETPRLVVNHNPDVCFKSYQEMTAIVLQDIKAPNYTFIWYMDSLPTPPLTGTPAFPDTYITSDTVSIFILDTDIPTGGYRNFTVEVIDALGCSARDNFEARILDSLYLSLTPYDTNVCQNGNLIAVFQDDELIIEAMIVGTISLYDTLTWVSPDVDLIEIPGYTLTPTDPNTWITVIDKHPSPLVTSLVGVSTDSIGTFVIKVWGKDEFGCEVMDSIIVKVNTKAVAGGDQTECEDGGSYTFAMHANHTVIDGEETGAWVFITNPVPTGATIEDPTDSLTNITIPAGFAVQVAWVITSEYCGYYSADTITLTALVRPKVSLNADWYGVCDGQPLTITATVTDGTPPYTFIWMPDGISADPTVVGADNEFIVDTSVPVQGSISVIVTDASAGACASDTAKAIVSVIDHNVDIDIEPIPSILCNHSMINLNATVVAADTTAPLSYEWLMYTYSVDPSTAPILTLLPIDVISTGVTTLNASYLIDVVQPPVDYIRFELRVHHVGYDCPQSAFTDSIKIRKSIKIDIVGSDRDTVCHGGSVDMVFKLSNYEPITETERIFYRIYENGVYWKEVFEVYVLPLGKTQIEFTTHPSLHTNENGPESYCYTVEVWQGSPDSVVFIPSTPINYNCHSYSACHWVMDLKDPVVTISGPDNIYLHSTPPTFTANVVGGHGDITYTWYLNGVLVPGATGSTYTVTDPAILGTVGDYDIAVKVFQSYSGCEADLVVHPFHVFYPDVQIEIQGPDAVCACSGVTLTAVVSGNFNDYTLQWKRDGQFIFGATGHTYDFFAPCDEIDITRITVELTFGTCNVLTSPVKDIQIVPKTVVVVNDYMMCADGMVDVSANAIVYADGEIYRYIWYDVDTNIIDITYVNHRIFDTPGTYFVVAEMLNSACASDLAEFTITEIPELVIELTVNSNYLCDGGAVILEDVSTSTIGAIYKWFKNGVEIPGATLRKLIDFPIAHNGIPSTYEYTAIAYLPVMGCVSELSNVITVTIDPQFDVYIEGPNTICETQDLTLNGFVVNYDNHTGPLNYFWTLLGAGAPVDPTPYINGFKEAYTYKFEEILADNFDSEFEGAHPIPANDAASYSTVGLPRPNLTWPVCSGTAATSLQNMYLLGAADAAASAAATTAVTDAEDAAAAFIATVEGGLLSAAEAKAIADALIAGPYISTPEGLIAGTANALSTLDPALKAAIIDYYAYDLTSFTLANTPNPVLASYIPAARITTLGGILTLGLTCNPAYNNQTAAYKDGYLFGYWDTYNTAFMNAYYQTILNGLKELYSDKYGEVFADRYNQVLDIVGTGTFIIGDPDSEISLTMPAGSLPIRNYPYHFFLTVYNDNGCKTTAGPFEVNVEQMPEIGITVDKTKICLGETIMLTANVEPHPNMEYQWYADGVAIPGATAPILYITPDEAKVIVYSFTVTQMVSLCQATSNQVFVTVVAAPVIDVEVDVTHICQGGAVVLNATIVPGAVYTWYKNGVSIPGATAHILIDFPVAQSGIQSEYYYTVTATVDPGCTSEPAHLTTPIVVNPQLEAIIEGPTEVCDSAEIVLNGFVLNLDALTGALSYKWTLPGVTATQVNPNDEYLPGFVYGYETTLDMLLESNYATSFTTIHPLPNPSSVDYYYLSGSVSTTCSGGSSEDFMFALGQTDAQASGDAILAAQTDAQAAANSFIALAEASIRAQAALDAAADAAIAGPHISYAKGVAEGNAYANAAVTAELIFNILAPTLGYNFNAFDYSDAPNPTTGYTPAYWTVPFIGTHISCATGVVTQNAAYKQGYKFAYRTLYNQAFMTELYAHVVSDLANIYTTEYSTVFDANYVEFLDIVGDGSFTPGVAGYDLVLKVKLPARPYPYNFFLTVYNENGCEVTVGPHQVTVSYNPVPVKEIVMVPSHGNICIGGQVTLTAIVENPDEVEYYIWYQNGIEIQGLTLPTITLSPLTVDDNTTIYNYNVVAVPFPESGYCPAFPNPELEKTVTVRRNPVVELHGEHHVCDVYSGGIPEGVDLYPNAVVTAYIDGHYIPWHCGPLPVPGQEWALYDLDNYSWYVDGALQLTLIDPCDPQRLRLALAAKAQPYLIKMEYHSDYGCTAWSNEFEVYVHPQPVVEVVASEPDICKGGSVTLYASLENIIEGDYLYQWYLGPTATPEYAIPGAWLPTFNTGPLNAVDIVDGVEVDSNGVYIFTYWVTVKQYTTYDDHDTVKCYVEKMAHLFVHPTPVIDSITVSADYICSGGQVTITAHVPPPPHENFGNFPYFTWFRNGVELQYIHGASFSQSLTALDDDVTTYTYNAYVTYENSGCFFMMQDTLKKTVTVYRNPIVTLAGDANICKTDSIAVTAFVDPESNNVGELSYTWRVDGEIRDAIDFGPFYKEQWPPRFEPYLITVEVTRGNGCTTISEPFAVYVHDVPVVNITVSEENICTGGQVTLTAHLNDYNTSNMTYQWYVVTYETIDDEIVPIETLIPGATNQVYGPVVLTETTVFKVEVIQTHSLCNATHEITVNVSPKPVITSIAISAEYVCSGAQVTVTAYASEDNLGFTPYFTWFRNGIELLNIHGASFTETLMAIDDDMSTYTYNALVAYENSGCFSIMNEELAQTVTVYRNPVVAISGDANICEDQPISLTAFVDHESDNVGDLSYIWRVDGEPRDNLQFGLGDEFGQFYVEYWPPRFEPYVVTVEVTRGHGCTTISAPFLVYVHVLPVVNITASEAEICEGGDVILTAHLNDYNTPNITYQWFAITYELDSIPFFDDFIVVTVPVTTLIPGATDQTYGPVVLTQTTTFKVEVVQTHSLCVGTDEFTINVIPRPVVVWEGDYDDTICKGEQVILTVAAMIEDEYVLDATYQWYEDGVLVPGAILYYYITTPTTPGTHVYEVQAFAPASGCISDRVVVATIVVKDAPSVVIAGPTLICNEAVDATLYAIVDPVEAATLVTYQWFLNNEPMEGETGATLDISNLAASPYEYSFTVQITDPESGCVVLSAVHTVYVGQFVEIGITADKLEICKEETVKLEANVSYANNMLYQWYTVVDGELIEIPGATAPIYYVTPEATTTYTFIATQIGSECVAPSNMVTVHVIPTPVFNVTYAEDTICQGTQYTFETELITTEAVTFVWYVNGQQIPGAELGSLTYTFDHYGTFVFTVAATTQIAGCTSALDTIGIITVKDAPQVYIEGVTVVCYPPEQNAMLYAIVDPTNAPVTYLWYINGVPQENETSTIIIDQEPSQYPYIYEVEITDIESGCVVKSIAHTVYVQQDPVIAIAADKDYICANEPVKLEAFVSESPNMIYQWYGNGELIPNANGPILYVYAQTETTTYTFEATAIGSGCVATSNSVTVTVIEKPDLQVTTSTEPVTICLGEQVSFATQIVNEVPSTYTWYINGIAQTGANLSTFTSDFDHPGVYTIQVLATSILAGCVSDLVDAGTVTVKAPPTVTIAGTTNICDATVPTFLLAMVTPQNESIYQYQWYIGNPDGTYTELGTEATQQILNIPSPYPYSYRVQVTDIESGCVVMSAVHQVTVHMYSDLQITSYNNKLEDCYGIPFTFTANMNEYVNWLFQWYEDGELLEGETGLVLTIVPTVGDHSYYFIATQIGSECTATSNTIQIVVHPIPEQPALTINDNTICNNDPVTVTGNIYGVYTWYRNGVLFAENAQNVLTDQPTAVNVLTTYTYTATVTVDGCTSILSEPVTVTVHPIITVSIVGEHSVCEQAVEGEHLALHAFITNQQPGVTYHYTWWYVQGNNPPVQLAADNDLSTIIVPNDLPINPTSSPYFFYVDVVAVGYDCTAGSAPHTVHVLTQPTVSILVNNPSICLGGTITATAYPVPTPTPENPYNYHWFIDGVATGANSPTVTLSNFVVGVNTISVEVVRSYAVGSCHGEGAINVNVLTIPSLALTQNIEGLDLPGMCVGGQVNFASEVINFDATLVNVSNFTYRWTKDGNLIPNAQGTTWHDNPNVGTHIYTVQAIYPVSSLGCNTLPMAFEPVKVVLQPTIEIATKDYNLFEVCEGATLEFINDLPTGIADANIQVGYQYNWKDEPANWNNWTNQIPPREYTFNPPGGVRSFVLTATFANPTCHNAVSNTLTITVLNDPKWDYHDITPDPTKDLCLGEEVSLDAAYIGGVFGGTMQWAYSYNGGDFIDHINGVGGHKKHTPQEAGEYVYRVSYIPIHELSGCDVKEWPSLPLTVLESITPIARFVKEDGVIPSTCAENTQHHPVVLHIEFRGEAPFTIHVREDNGTIRLLSSSDYELKYNELTGLYDWTVTPGVTTTYTIESVEQQYKCVTGTFVKSSITVIVTNVKVLTDFVEVCNGVAVIDLSMIAYVTPQATITLPCGDPFTVPIVPNGTFSTLKFNVPACLGLGTHTVTLTIDGCDYNVTVMLNASYGVDGNSSQLVYLRWEGNADVLAVSNNYHPESPYYNGGYEFTNYQWYKNGYPIEGATQQYYQHFGKPGTYSVHLVGYKVDADGHHLYSVEFSTCGYDVVSTSSIMVYPVPAHVDEPVYIELNLTSDELEGAYIDIYDAKGAHLKHIEGVTQKVRVDGFNAQGVYFGSITTGTNEIKAVKFIISK